MGDIDHKEIHMVEFMIHLPCVAFYCLKRGRVNECELLVYKLFASHILVYMGIRLGFQINASSDNTSKKNTGCSVWFSIVLLATYTFTQAGHLEVMGILSPSSSRDLAICVQ